MIDFNEKLHKYTYIGTDKRYIGKSFVSATTFIGWFKNPYDSEYWATYKAIKDYYTIISEQRWNIIKRFAGGWENVVDFYNRSVLSGKVNFEVQNDIIHRKLDYLTLWKTYSNIANDKGSKIHKDLEDDVIGSKSFVGDDGNVYKVSGQKFFYENPPPSPSSGSYPECIIYNLEYMICGMVDRVEADEIWLDITDYKTNKEVTKEPFKNAKMKILGIPDCNYYHYMLQMSLYGWMLEKFGYKVRSLTLEHLKTKDRYTYKVDDVETIKMEYRPDLIEKMVMYRYKRKHI